MFASRLLISQRYRFLTSTVLGLRVPSSDREGVKAAEHVEATCGQGTGGVLHVGWDVARSEGELEVSFCSANNAHITSDGQGAW